MAGFSSLQNELYTLLWKNVSSLLYQRISFVNYNVRCKLGPFLKFLVIMTSYFYFLKQISFIFNLHFYMHKTIQYHIEPIPQNNGTHIMNVPGFFFNICKKHKIRFISNYFLNMNAFFHTGSFTYIHYTLYS